jgi:hypothetical protein
MSELWLFALQESASMLVKFATRGFIVKMYCRSIMQCIRRHRYLALYATGN